MVGGWQLRAPAPSSHHSRYQLEIFVLARQVRQHATSVKVQLRQNSRCISSETSPKTIPCHHVLCTGAILSFDPLFDRSRSPRKSSANLAPNRPNLRSGLTKSKTTAVLSFESEIDSPVRLAGVLIVPPDQAPLQSLKPPTGSRTQF